MKCQSGKHEWTDPVSAERCCSKDWHRTRRAVKDVDELDPQGRFHCGNGIWAGWVYLPAEEVAA